MIRLGKGLWATLLPVFGLLSASGVAKASTYTGNSAYGRLSDGSCAAIASDNGEFNDPKNWGGPCQPGSVPGATSTADLGSHGVHGTNVNVAGLIIGGGSLTADTITTKSLTLNGGGIGGSTATASTVAVANIFNWTGGSIGSTTVTLGAKCATTISGNADSSTGAGNKYLSNGATIINQGTINWSGAGIGNGSGGGTLRNAGTFKMNSDGVVSSESAGLGIGFINTGLFAKIGGSGETRIGFGASFLNNGGTLQAKSGVFDPSVAYYNTTTLSTGSTIASGAGVVQQGYAWSFNGTINLGGTFRLTTNDNYGKATFTGAGKIDWRSGGFSANPDTTAIVFAPTMHAAMSGTGVKVLSNLTNQGILTWNGGTIGGGTLQNTGTFNLLNDGDISGLSLINKGTFAKVGGSGTVKTGNHLIDNSGVIDVQKGVLELDANPNSGSDIFRGGTLIEGTGKVIEYTPVTCSGTITVDNILQLDDTKGGNAGVVGPNTFSGKGQINWYGGTMDGVNFATGFTVNALGTLGKTLMGPCTNAGIFNWRGGASIVVGSTFTLTNTGTYNVLSPGLFAQGRINNTGTLNTYEGSCKFFGKFANNGVINLGSAAKPGLLQLAGDDGETFHNYGTLNAFIMDGRDGHYSQLQALTNGNVVTNVVLGGTLALKANANFKPDAATQLVLLKVIPDRASYSGTFTTVSGIPSFNGRAFKFFYNPLDVTLGLPFTLAGHTSRTLFSGEVGTTQGIGGVAVSLQPASGSAQTTTTDANGYFTFSGLQLGTYTVTPTKENVVFDPLSKKVVLPAPGGTDASISFETYSTTAKVVNTAGAPIAGVSILIQGTGIFAHDVVTNAQGLALFPDLGPGTYKLTPEDQGDFSFTPASANEKLPAAGVTGETANGLVIFTRKASPATIKSASPSGNAG